MLLRAVREQHAVCIGLPETKQFEAGGIWSFSLQNGSGGVGN